MSALKEKNNELCDTSSIIEIFNQLEEHFKMNDPHFFSQKPHSIPKVIKCKSNNEHCIITLNSKNTIRYKLKKVFPLGIKI